MLSGGLIITTTTLEHMYLHNLKITFNFQLTFRVLSLKVF